MSTISLYVAHITDNKKPTVKVGLDEKRLRLNAFLKFVCASIDFDKIASFNEISNT